jgi:hypothetical protein
MPRQGFYTAVNWWQRDKTKEGDQEKRANKGRTRASVIVIEPSHVRVT